MPRFIESEIAAALSEKITRLPGIFFITPENAHQFIEIGFPHDDDEETDEDDGGEEI